MVGIFKPPVIRTGFWALKTDLTDFCRIQADDLASIAGQGFVETKKMVLVKFF